MIDIKIKEVFITITKVFKTSISISKFSITDTYLTIYGTESLSNSFICFLPYTKRIECELVKDSRSLTQEKRNVFKLSKRYRREMKNG